MFNPAYIYPALLVIALGVVVYLMIRSLLPKKPAQDRVSVGGTPVSQTEEGKLYAIIATDECPDCHHLGFYAGPQGGMSQNIYCANGDCRSAFNITPMIGTAERIGKAPDYIYKKTKAPETAPKKTRKRKKVRA